MVAFSLWWYCTGGGIGSGLNGFSGGYEGMVSVEVVEDVEIVEGMNSIEAVEVVQCGVSVGVVVVPSGTDGTMEVEGGSTL